MKVLPVLAAAAVAAATAVVYATAFHPVVKQRGELAAQLAELQKTNAVLEAQIAELRRRQNDFRTDEAYVELEARRNGLSRPNETVFDFSVGGK
ncbi:MAG: septum formation initiator family protein [Kiritimatiellae bacterium]|nr:septum formation initiator family protein [Kiritimatiellia bacterium]